MNHAKELALEGRNVRLEQLEMRHVAGLTYASAIDPSLYRWTAAPIGRKTVESYITTAAALCKAGAALAFATVRTSDGAVIGSSRFFDIERFHWPEGHPRRDRAYPDVCEIGYTWLSAPAIRTAANTEAKLLMLTHAFEVWGVLRVCFHTDSRNDRSAAALARIGAKFEGILRAHKIAPDSIARDSKRFSIVASEWPEVKKALIARLQRA